MTTLFYNDGFQMPLLACSVCFGDPNSSLTIGLNMGILSLLAVVLAIWIAIAAFFIQLAKKSRIKMSGST